MKKMVPDRNIEDLLLPYSAVATDIINGKEIIFNKGSLYDAIRASISIPTVFTPFEYNGLKLVDGGVLNPIPINAVKRTEDDMLVVVNVGGDEKNIPTQTSNKSSIKNIKYLSKIQDKLDNIIPKNKSDKIGYYNLLNKTTSLMVQKISNLTLKEYQPDVLIEIAHNSFGTYEFYKSKEIINTGVIETRKALNNIKTH
jgi:NTE family protein